MPERKKDGNFVMHLVWKKNRILHYGSLFFIMRLILVRIWRDNLPKFGRAITKFFLGTVLTTGLGASILSKHYLKHLSTKSRGLAEKLRPLHKTFFFLSSVNLYEDNLKITLSEL